MTSDRDVERFTGLPGMSLMEAMQRIDAGSRGIIFIVDSDSRLMGSLTDGDVRRYILRTGGLLGSAADAMFRDVKALGESETAGAEQLMKEKEINSIPVVDDERRILRILFRERKLKDTRRELKGLPDAPVIIMAGGKGTRLYPYTKILPKPLIPIGDVPIIERIMDRFYMGGFDDFYITVNYRKEMIKAYFADQKLPYRIHFVEEDVPLGTAGSIRLIEDEFTTPVFVTNCDILIDVDLALLLEHHMTSGNAITVVSSLQNVQIPYGVLQAREQGIIVGMEEKPSLSYLINTGMYIVDPAQFAHIPDGRMFHMTDLMLQTMRAGGRVGMYPIGENAYLDMGQFEEMRRMEERINEESALETGINNEQVGYGPIPDIL